MDVKDTSVEAGDNVGQRHARITGHPVGGQMPQVMQGPVGAERSAGTVEHPVGGVVGQPAGTGGAASTTTGHPARPGLGRAAAPDTAAATRTRPGRPAAAAGAGSPCGSPRSAAAPGSASRHDAPSSSDARAPVGHPECHQCPVAVRAQRGEQLVELLLRDVVRRTPGKPGPVPPGTLTAVGLHRVVVRMGPPAPRPGQRERVDDRAGPGFAVEVVKAAQNTLAMHHRGRRVTAARPRLPGHRIGDSGPGRGSAGRNIRRGRIARAAGLDGDLDPAAEVPGLGAGSPDPTAPRPPTRTGTSATVRSHTRAAWSPAGQTPASPAGTPQPGRPGLRPDRATGTAPTDPPRAPATPLAGRPRPPDPAAHPVRS